MLIVGHVLTTIFFFLKEGHIYCFIMFFTTNCKMPNMLLLGQLQKYYDVLEMYIRHVGQIVTSCWTDWLYSKFFSGNRPLGNQ